MKKCTIVILIVFVTSFFVLSSCSAADCVDSISFVELGVPTQSRYSEGVSARSPWDMAIFGDKLYIGSGDYDKNSGPVDMWCYDIKNGTW